MAPPPPPRPRDRVGGVCRRPRPRRARRRRLSPAGGERAELAGAGRRARCLAAAELALRPARRRRRPGHAAAGGRARISLPRSRIRYRHPDRSPYPASECPMLLPRTTGETISRDLDSPPAAGTHIRAEIPLAGG